MLDTAPIRINCPLYRLVKVNFLVFYLITSSNVCIKVFTTSEKGCYGALRHDLLFCIYLIIQWYFNIISWLPCYNYYRDKFAYMKIHYKSFTEFKRWWRIHYSKQLFYYIKTSDSFKYIRDDINLKLDNNYAGGSLASLQYVLWIIINIKKKFSVNLS